MAHQALILAIEGTPAAIRVVPHNSNPNLFVLKSHHPEAGVFFAKLMGIEHGNVWQGSNFWMTTVSRSEFMANVAKLLAKLPAAEGPALISAPKCEDCGCGDGTHWQFCQTAKALN